MKSFRPRPSQAQGSGKPDSLLRLFDSQFFDGWLALTYIFQNEKKGVHDYLCNKLHELPTDRIEMYLSQFCQLIVMRPGSSLERVIVDMCSNSLRIAVKVYWLFQAITQDQPKNERARSLLDRCERKALDGNWDLPFKCPMLDPPPLLVESKEDSAFMHKSPGLVEGKECPSYHVPGVDDLSEDERSASPVGGGSASLCSSHDIVQGLEGMFGASAGRSCSGSMGDMDLLDVVSNDTERSSATFERCRMLRQELGEGEGVSALVVRASRNEAAGGSGCLAASEGEDCQQTPQGLRQTTFGATLDFVDALCDASSNLVQLPHDSRLTALKRALVGINSEIDHCNANGVTAWFPLGNKNQRVLRLVPEETIILNSREKAPFLLLIEVMDTDAAAEEQSTAKSHTYSDAPTENKISPDKPVADSSTSETNDLDDNPNSVITETPTASESFDKKMDHALAGLRGKEPLVRVRLNINELEMVESLDEAETSGSEEVGVESTASSLLKEGAMSLMVSKFLQCSTNCINLATAEEWVRSQQQTSQKLISVSLEVAGGVDLKMPSPSKKSRRVPSQEALELVAGKMKQDTLQHLTEQSVPSIASDTRSISEASISRDLTQDEQLLRVLKKQKRASDVFGERWSEKEEAVKKRSPHGHRPGWNLCRVVVKSGDDCRQELMAIQLIKAFQDIFLESRLPLWVSPYEVLVTSNRTALIEFIPDTLSIHSIKNRSPAGTSLSQHFFDKFIKGTPECAAAQRNFVESLAAYSLITYILQLKDRHNGNILMDDMGHVIHIDFGFMLSNSPGGVNFEAAPFKLTREYLEIMDSNAQGEASDLFDYFKVLCIKGFLVCRKHSERILLLCDMMSKTGFPCFKTGDKAIKALRKRFHPNIPEQQCLQIVIGAISDSLDAWRTRQYDYYQRVLNGIL